MPRINGAGSDYVDAVHIIADASKGVRASGLLLETALSETTKVN